MGSPLVQHAALIVTMDHADTRWTDGGIYVERNVIRKIGPIDSLPQQADRVINEQEIILLPGLVNTHHHFYQTLTRNLPAAQNTNLFSRLRTHYPIWARLEAIYVSTQTAIVELILSGCTRDAKQ
jgi:8-oxoguanine deaminase